MSSGTAKDEYNSLCENMRWYSNIRLAQLTLFFALTAALLTVVFTSGPSLSYLATVALKIGGVLTGIIFWILEERTAEYWRHFRRRAMELEGELGYRQFSTTPRHKISTTHILRVFFAAVLLLWVISLFVSYSSFAMT